MTRQTGGACKCEFTDRAGAEQVASDYLAGISATTPTGAAASSAAAKEEANKAIEEHSRMILAASKAVEQANAARIAAAAEAKAAANAAEAKKANLLKMRREANEQAKGLTTPQTFSMSRAPASPQTRPTSNISNSIRKAVEQERLRAAAEGTTAKYTNSPKLIENYSTSATVKAEANAKVAAEAAKAKAEANAKVAAEAAKKSSPTLTGPVSTIKRILQQFYDNVTTIKGNKDEYIIRIKGVIAYYKSIINTSIDTDLIAKKINNFTKNFPANKEPLTTALNTASDDKGKVTLIIKALESILSDKQTGGMRRSRPIQRTRRSHTRTHRVGKRSSKRSSKRLSKRLSKRQRLLGKRITKRV